MDRRDSVPRERVSGRFAADNAMQFAEAICAATGDDDRAGILDCERMSHIGGMGIRALTMTAKHLTQSHTAFPLYAPSNALRAVLHVSAIDRIVPIHPTRPDALTSLGR